jgi:hypothetical protein
MVGACPAGRTVSAAQNRQRRARSRWGLSGAHGQDVHRQPSQPDQDEIATARAARRGCLTRTERRSGLYSRRQQRKEQEQNTPLCRGSPTAGCDLRTRTAGRRPPSVPVTVGARNSPPAHQPGTCLAVPQRGPGEVPALERLPAQYSAPRRKSQETPEGAGFGINRRGPIAQGSCSRYPPESTEQGQDEVRHPTAKFVSRRMPRSSAPSASAPKEAAPLGRAPWSACSTSCMIPADPQQGRGRHPMAWGSPNRNEIKGNSVVAFRCDSSAGGFHGHQRDRRQGPALEQAAHLRPRYPPAGAGTPPPPGNIPAPAFPRESIQQTRIHPGCQHERHSIPTSRHPGCPAAPPASHRAALAQAGSP